MQQKSMEDQIPPGWTLKSSSLHAAPGTEVDLVECTCNRCSELAWWVEHQ
jgi:hypothetical protein